MKWCELLRHKLLNYFEMLTNQPFFFLVMGKLSSWTSWSKVLLGIERSVFVRVYLFTISNVLNAFAVEFVKFMLSTPLWWIFSKWEKAISEWLSKAGKSTFVCLFCSFRFFMDLFIFTFQMPDCHDDSLRLNNETLCRKHDVLNKAIATGASL